MTARRKPDPMRFAMHDDGELCELLDSAVRAITDPDASSKQIRQASRDIADLCAILKCGRDSADRIARSIDFAMTQIDGALTRLADH
jgi:hypothetical protein